MLTNVFGMASVVSTSMDWFRSLFSFPGKLWVDPVTAAEGTRCFLSLCPDEAL